MELENKVLKINIDFLQLWKDVHHPGVIPKRTKYRYIKEDVSNLAHTGTRYHPYLDISSNLHTRPMCTVSKPLSTMNQWVPKTLSITPSELVETPKSSSSALLCLSNQLKSWAVTGNVSKTNVSKLLQILHPYHPSLPLCATTLLGNRHPVMTCGSGQIIFFELRDKVVRRIRAGFKHFDCSGSLYREYLLQAAAKHSSLLTVNISIDGLPLFKSCSTQLWPILCSINESINSMPFSAALYVGQEKPTDLRAFVSPFVKQFSDLCDETLECDGVKYLVRTFALIADAPARAFVKNVHQYNAYFGCEFCGCEGEFHGGKVVFLQEGEKRTDFRFSNNKEDNQNGSTPLNRISAFGCVTQVPPEYMHSICLGIVRKLLLLWTSSKKNANTVGYRLIASKRVALNEVCLSMGSNLPHDFQRKIRDLQDLKRWKATEFRTFLLYVGAAALRDILPSSLYRHFLLHFAITVLLCNHTHTVWLQHARVCLNLFVTEMSTLYGKSNVVYNVHCLRHLPDFVERLGSLHLFSAFPFENALHGIKLRVRASYNPLQQIANRTLELEDENMTAPYKVSTFRCGEVYKLLSGPIVLSNSIVGDYCYGSELIFVRDLYSSPYDSRRIGIGIYKSMTPACQGTICGKYVALTQPEDHFILFPFVCNHLIDTFSVSTM